MADIGLTEQGCDELAVSLSHAADVAGDLTETNRAAGELVLGAVVVPVRTGYLESRLEVTAAADGVTVSNDAPYAGFVHARNPFLFDALTAREGDVVDLYATRVDDVVDLIRGA